MEIGVYEHVMAGGCGTEDVPAGLAAEGAAMLRWAVAQLVASKVPVSVSYVVHERWHEAVGRLPGGRPVLGTDWHRLLDDMASRCETLLLIAPECGGVLGELVQQYAATRRLLNLSPRWTALFSDKVSTARLLASLGIAHVPHELQCSECWTDVVIERRDVAGCEGQRVCRASDTDELARGYCVSPFCGGLSASVGLVLAAGRVVRMPPAYQWVACSADRVRYGGGAIPLPGDLAEQLHRTVDPLARALAGEVGFVGIDVVFPWHSGGPAAPRVVEVNPRLTTSFVAQSMATGVNVMELLLGGTDLPDRLRARTALCFWPDGTVRSML